MEGLGCGEAKEGNLEGVGNANVENVQEGCPVELEHWCGLEGPGQGGQRASCIKLQEFLQRKFYA